jgi:hypothetical protein
MAPVGFSEFTYGFGFLFEQVNANWLGLTAAPILPSLQQEQHGGWDVHLPLIGAPFFYQFKVPQYMTGANSTFIADGTYQGHYYRLDLHRRANNLQHRSLRTHCVNYPNTFYASPELHTPEQFTNSFLAHTLVDNSRIIPVDEGTSLRFVGYGRPILDRVVWSSEGSVQLVTESQIEEDKLHFYEIPVPPSFISGAGRRGITVALAYDPPVRSSRKEYLARTMTVDVLQGLTTQEAAHYKARFQGAGQPPTPPSGAALALRPPSTVLQWSTLQVRRIQWARPPRLRIAGQGNNNLHVIVGCQKRFPTGLDFQQGYGLVVNFWHSGEEPRLYQELRALIRQPVRVRIQP